MEKYGTKSLGSMGTDAPLALMSNRSKIIFECFKNRFSQVKKLPHIKAGGKSQL